MTRQCNIALAGVIGTILLITPSFAADSSWNFIEARSDRLYDGDQEFRFISFNIPNLHVVEDNFAFTAQTPWRWPDEFEITDALESVWQMGGTVVRPYVLSTYREDSNMGEHAFVLGPGKFNEKAYRMLDLVLEVARRKRMRIIVPFIDNWHWQGGRAQYAGFRGKKADEFWTDEQIIQDFERTVKHTVCRTNSRTGIPYKDDPTIFGWETGNELDPAPAWTRRIAAYIKSLDPNHLVIDGCSLRGVQLSSLDDPNVDVITTHHYPSAENNDFVPAVRRARAQTKGKKPYFVGEFGFVPTQNVAALLDFVIEQHISGALLWSLRFHNRDGGFYWHSEPAGGGLYKAYHWPGFATGAAYDEQAVLALMRAKAFQIRQMPLPPLEPPRPPHLLPIPDVGSISWQGSAGASSYDVQRASRDSGPWQTVGEDVTDDRVQHQPLFNDQSAEIGRSYYYRVIAENRAGRSPSSNVVGPVDCQQHVFVDDCADLNRVVTTSGQPEAVTGDDRRALEDLHRIKLKPGSTLEYHVAGPMQSVRVYLFMSGSAADVQLSFAADGKIFRSSTPRINTYFTRSQDYDYAIPVRLQASPAIREARQLRIAAPDADRKKIRQSIEISRVEIRYGQ